jgi:hypothetical protein
MTQIAIATPPSLQKYRSHLRSFFEGMVRKLDLNSHKNTPDKEQIETMLELLRAELTELEDQLKENRLSPNSLVETQDAANYAFLIFLALRRDGAPTDTELFINEFLEVDPKTGKVFCKKGRAGSRYKPGDEISGDRSRGYVHIKMQGHYRAGVNKVSMPRSHLIWWKRYGEWPTGVIDHKNGIKSDDRITNLQDATFTQNNLNRKRVNKYPSFVTCYKPTGRQHLKHYGKFVYQRSYKGMAIRFGYYDTPGQAAKMGEEKWKEHVVALSTASLRGDGTGGGSPFYSK